MPERMWVVVRDDIQIDDTGFVPVYHVVRDDMVDDIGGQVMAKGYIYTKMWRIMQDIRAGRIPGTEVLASPDHWPVRVRKELHTYIEAAIRKAGKDATVASYYMTMHGSDVYTGGIEVDHIPHIEFRVIYRENNDETATR